MKNTMLLLLIVLCQPLHNSAQHKSISDDYLNTVIHSVGDLFEKNYVFPEKGKQVRDFLEENHRNGHYDNIVVLDSLTNKLKQDIFEITKDKHVNFVISHAENGESREQEDTMLDFFNSIENFGLTKVEVLEDNIGLLEITFFHPLRANPEAAKAATAAMEKLKNCKAIIYDLRGCMGGVPEMLNYLITYLYPKGEIVHLNTFYYRPTNQYSDTHTLDEVPGNRIPDTPVYVLTSNRTFSCGEEFAYDIKHLNRGKIIGETSGGGAHPVQPMRVNEELQVMIPSGRAINPITKTNWEGVGVVPHVQIPADQALDKAIELISSY